MYLYHTLFSYGTALSIHPSLSLFLLPLSNDSVQGPPTLYICSIDKDLTGIQSQTPYKHIHTGTYTRTYTRPEPAAVACSN